MSLPNPGMDAVPFTPLTAAFLDDMIENIEALAAGTGLNSSVVTSTKIADGAVTGSKLATSAITLGYAQITAGTTTASTTPTQITGLTTTVTIPSGGRRIKITAFVPRVYSTGSPGENQITIWDGTVGSGTALSKGQTSVPATSNPNTVVAMAIVTPSAGSKTYNIGMHTTAGTLTIDANAVYPAFILVEAI